MRRDIRSAKVRLHLLYGKRAEKFAQRGAYAVVQGSDVLKARLFFCRVNVKVNQVRLDLREKGGGGMGSVWKVALSAVFNRLQKRVFGYAPPVYVNVNVLSVLARDAWVSDYEGKGKARAASFYFVEQVWALLNSKRLVKALAQRLAGLKVVSQLAVNCESKGDVRARHRFFQESLAAHFCFACRPF